MSKKTLIVVILDRSGSMASIGEEAVGMFNRFIEEQKQLPGEAQLSLIQFDDQYQEDYLMKDIKGCKPLIYLETFRPRGMTALYDALGKAIIQTDEAIKKMGKKKRPDQVLFSIITDGQENASREFSNTSVERLKNQYIDLGWDFIFMAAGIDASVEGAKFGMDISKTISFDSNARGMSATGATLSNYTAAYRSTGDASMNLGDYEKEDF